MPGGSTFQVIEAGPGMTPEEWRAWQVARKAKRKPKRDLDRALDDPVEPSESESGGLPPISQ
jgi:hypothetical protein